MLLLLLYRYPILVCVCAGCLGYVVGNLLPWNYSGLALSQNAWNWGPSAPGDACAADCGTTCGAYAHCPSKSPQRTLQHMEYTMHFTAFYL